MDILITDLWKDGKTDEIINNLNKADESEVVKSISKHVTKGKADPLPFIKSVLSCSRQPDDRSTNRFTAVCVELIRLLQKREINSKTAYNIVSLMLTELDAAQPACLNDVAHFYITCVKDGSFSGSKASDLFPKILSLLSTHESVPTAEGDMKGSELKSHLINSLCSCKWPTSVALHMCPLFKDIPLTADELKFLIKKILRLLPDLELSEQPAVVFQLLVLSGKGEKRLVLEGICQYYTTKDDSCRGRSTVIDSEDLMSDPVDVQTLRQIEGTAILHITQAVKHDQGLGAELLKYYKTLHLSDPMQVIGPFNLCLMLSILQLHHFEEKIFEFLKSTIFKCLSDEERCSKSLWARQSYTETVRTEQLVLEAVEHSTYGWDHVIQGLMKLGFGLMDSYGPKLVFGAMPENIPLDGHKPPGQLACQLGRKILLKTFKGHGIVRSEILDQIFSHIVMRSTSPVSHYLDLLCDTVQSAPQLLLESSGKVQEVCLKLAELPPKSAEGLLNAIQPLLKLSPLLKDTIIIVLRKAMFSRQLNARKIGSLGFLLILRSFRVLGCLPSSQVSQPISLSQLQVDVHGQYNAASNEALCLEILGNLRRSFTQQADIRLNIYQGLSDVLHRNSQLLSPVLEMLVAQLKKYYEDREDPPLRLDSCLVPQRDQVFLAEPLSHLLCCIQQCVRESANIVARTRHSEEDEEEEDSDQPNTLKILETILTSLTKRLIDSDMEDFELDKNADFSQSSVGIKNTIKATLLVGLYETLMEYTFEAGSCTAERCTTILQLFEKHAKLTAVLSNKATATGGKKGRPTPTSKPTNSLMSMQGTLNILRKIFADSDGEHENGIKDLRVNKNFLPFVIGTAIGKLGQISSKGVCDGETQSREKIFNLCWTFGRLFFKYYVENQLPGSESADTKLVSLCVEGLACVITIATSSSKPAVLQCLDRFEKEDKESKEYLCLRDSEANAKIHNHIKQFQRLIMTQLNEDSNHTQWKNVCSLFSSTASLASHLTTQGAEYGQVYNWVLKVATDHDIGDSSTNKQIMTTLLQLSHQTENLPQLLRSVCQDIHSQFGDIEQDCEVEDKTHFSATKSSNCPTVVVLMLTLGCLESELDDIEWVIKRHKAQMQTGNDDDDLDSTQVETKERSLCVRLGMLVNSLIELAHSAVKTKPCLQYLLKVLTKLFNTLSSLAKHYILLYTSRKGHINSRFEKLVTLVGRQLTQPTYSLVIYVQMSELDEVQGNEKKDKGKKKGATSAQNGVAKALKQMKTIPNLIFAMEQLEKFLIHLSKKSKVNLMQNFKLSTSRDFRINSATVTNVVENGVSSDDEPDELSDAEGGRNSDGEQDSSERNKQNDEEGEDSSDSEPENVDPQQAEPPAKKSKLSRKGKN